MAGFNYLINLQILGGNAIDRLISRTEQFDNAVGRSQRSVDRAGGSIDRMTQRGASGFSNMTTSVRSLIAQLGIAAFTLSSIQSTAQMDSLNRSIDFTGGEDGAKNLTLIRNEIDRLNLSATATYQGFSTLSGGFMGAGHSGETLRKVFTGMAEGATVFGLKSEELNRAYVALGQMAGKPVLSMEELKLQLQDAFPAAMSQAALAMDMPIGKFTELVGKGKVLTKDFLPKFADQLHETFGSKALDAANGPAGQLNLFNNSILNLKNSIGTSLMPMVTDLMNKGLIPLFGWFGKNMDLILTIGGALLTAKVAWGAYTLWTTIATGATGGFVGVMEALNFTMLANPVGLVIAGIVALGAAVIYAWNKFEGFRGTIIGVLEWLKTLGEMVWNLVAQRFIGLGKILEGVFDLDFAKVKDGINSILDNKSAFENAGSRLSKSFDEGWNKGKGMGGIDIPGMMGLGGDKKIGAFFDVPGGDAVNSAFPKGNGAADAAKELSGGKSVKDGIKGITEGGTKNITINVGSLNEGGITVHTTNLKEGVDQVRDMFMRMYLEVINSGNQVQTSG